MQRAIPFYSNTADDTHCFQAALLMVLKTFEPEEDFSFDDLDRVTGKKDGLWTWPFAGSVWMVNRGYEIVNIDSFDNGEFIKRGADYLVDIAGVDVAAEQVAHSDIETERLRAAKFVANVRIDTRVPTQSDLTRLLQSDFVSIVSINSKVLRGLSGYVGHSVVIVGVDDLGFIVHDPGLPAESHRHIDFATFERAWAFPNDAAKNILAFKR